MDEFERGGRGAAGEEKCEWMNLNEEHEIINWWEKPKNADGWMSEFDRRA
jgi:hypothetical protein